MRKRRKFARQVVMTPTPASRRPIFLRHFLKRKGFTLTEVMVASVLLSIVIFVAWTGLISVMNISQAAQAKTARQIELNTALDVMTAEVRRAQNINRSGAIAADGSTISVKDVVSNSGLDLDDLGPYGEIALYLELPTNLEHPMCSTANGPVMADTVDRIIYDVRPSPSGWLSPSAVVRYGRLPNPDGTIDPCTQPVANDIMADALTDVDDAPTCDGVLTGSAGFHTCTQGENVQLLFKSEIEGLDVELVSRSVTTRSASFTPVMEPQETPSLTLMISRDDEAKAKDYVDLAWVWSGPNVDERYTRLQDFLVGDDIWPYDVYIQHGEKNLKTPLGDLKSTTGINMRYHLTGDSKNACFEVEGTTPDQETVRSNRVCVLEDKLHDSQS